MERISQANGPKKQAVVTILMSNKIDVKPKLIKGDRERHFIVVKIKIHQDYVGVANIRAATYVKEAILNLKLYIDPDILRMGDFNSPLSPIDRSFR